MSYRIFVTEPIPEIKYGFKYIKNARFKIKKAFEPHVHPEELVDVDAVIAGDTKIYSDSLKKVNKLKVIGRFGAGIDNVDIKRCTEIGIVVFNLPGINAISVAEHVIGLMVGVAKKNNYMDQLVRKGKWAHKTRFLGLELNGKVLGLIGLGAIGREVAKRARMFNMKINYYDTIRSQQNIEQELGVEFSTFDKIIVNSDIISLHVPLTEDTRNLIGEKELGKMKKTCILINTSRGGIVNEKDLYRALKNRWIRGAGIDVLEKEPVKSHPLFKLDNILLTPHFAAWTIENFRRAAKKICININKTLEGEVPENAINHMIISRKSLI